MKSNLPKTRVTKVLTGFLGQLLLLLSWGQLAGAEQLTLAAAADLKFAMDEVLADFRKENASDSIEVVYGSSGKFYAQIREGAPYDLFFSADISYPNKLVADGYGASEVRPYAIGRIVLWSQTRFFPKVDLGTLRERGLVHLAIANPKHAPYGKRAQEALVSLGLWEELEKKLVFGENVAHTAQMVQSGNAQVGIIALSLALSPALSQEGTSYLLPESLHEPLVQGYLLTKRASGNALAKRFALFVEQPSTRKTLIRYGFILPGENADPANRPGQSEQ